MRGRRIGAAAALLIVSVLIMTGCGAKKQTETTASTGASPAANLSPTTPPGTQSVDSVVWALYRDTYTLDPIQVFDYPENTPAVLLYESLLHQAPDGSIGPGLAELTQPDDKTLVFTIKTNAKFWDGNPVTPDDVVFSLERQMDPKLGGFYGASFSRVQSHRGDRFGPSDDHVDPTGLLAGGGAVRCRRDDRREELRGEGGQELRTPAGKIMGTGAYMLEAWKPGAGVTVVVNPAYWNPDVRPLAKKIVLKGVPAASSLSSGLQTGGIQGSFLQDVSMLPQFEASSKLSVFKGPSWATDALVVCNLKGALGDVRVRKALSLAVDRESIISTVYKGAAELPRWLANSGNLRVREGDFRRRLPELARA